LAGLDVSTSRHAICNCWSGTGSQSKTSHGKKSGVHGDGVVGAAVDAVPGAAVDAVAGAAVDEEPGCQLAGIGDIIDGAIVYDDDAEDPAAWWTSWWV
jgi:uncharacterized protein affecting Mg2+/Co2+ transport